MSNTANHSVFPRFFLKPKQHKHLSKVEGRPIFEDVEYVEVRIAGDNKNIPIFKVTDEHRARWSEHYRAFKEGLEYKGTGTPVKEWVALPASKAAELTAMGFHTVEAVAECKDAVIHRLGMGGRKLVTDAKEYIEGVDAKDKEIKRLLSVNKKLRAQVKELKANG